MINIPNIGAVRDSPLFVGVIQSISLNSSACDVSVAYPADYGGFEKRFSGLPLVYYTGAESMSMNQWCFFPGDLVTVKMKASTGSSPLEADCVIGFYPPYKSGCTDWGRYNTYFGQTYEHIQGPDKPYPYIRSAGEISLSMGYEYTYASLPSTTQSSSSLGDSAPGCSCQIHNDWQKTTGGYTESIKYKQTTKISTRIKSGSLNVPANGGTVVITRTDEDTISGAKNEVDTVVSFNPNSDSTPIYTSIVCIDNAYVFYQNGQLTKATPLTFNNKSAFTVNNMPSGIPNEYTYKFRVGTETEIKNYYVSDIILSSDCLPVCYPSPMYKTIYNISESYEGLSVTLGNHSHTNNRVITSRIKGYDRQNQALYEYTATNDSSFQNSYYRYGSFCHFWVSMYSHLASAHYSYVLSKLQGFVNPAFLYFSIANDGTSPEEKFYTYRLW